MAQRFAAAGMAPDQDRLLTLDRFETVRARTVALTRHLQPEDMVLQSMPDASPVRWHLAHTTWFFETFILGRFAGSYEPYHEGYCHLFNSYYESVGSRWPREKRGLLSRPTTAEILSYRLAVEERVRALILSAADASFAQMRTLIELGLHHEEQHQELLCTDIKSALALNPLAPAVLPLPDSVGDEPKAVSAAANERWVSFGGGLREIGHEGEGFSFDNEGPRHKRYLADFALHGTPVTNGAYLEFIRDGGYENPLLWLSDGWSWVQAHGIGAPLYWQERDGEWSEYTMHGLLPLRDDRILCHVSAYEAFAFAEWAKARLPREEELEIALEKDDPASGQFLDPDGFIHPHLAGRDRALGSAYGSVWDWTQSSYSAYPGFRPAPGAVGEYNGKFMSGQLVLKGGSCATPPGHVRASYRNFFPPEARWQFTGIRLAKDL
jgi:ergothioneine biosynthesis protein EgtB